ncbi:hypothetical protein PUN28_014573 [Cardiocondyla obscurior]|uniref:Uncharacterized protein n=1 Tax=Cardiocondyla obscurior TaxID=286306 RepID=A0AAW2F0U0_9HYME
MFAKNIRTVRRIYVLSLRKFHTDQPFADCNKAFEKFKLKQAKMQCDDGLPVYLKAGVRDKILFNVTLAMLLVNTILSICAIRDLLRL